MENRVLGDYQIIKQIGEGSLGAVYLAEQRFMKRPFVLKILPAELASDRGFIQRFEEEVAVLTTLEHPNIVKIENVSFADGHYFLVVECVVDEFGETTNLSKYLLSRNRRLEEQEIISLLEQVADALDYAHEKRAGNRTITHRCLKPNNILVAKGASGPKFMVSDFGLSRIIGMGGVLTRTYKAVAEALDVSLAESYSAGSVEQQKLTALHNSFLQNFYFLAPEQRRIDSHQKVDAKADVYAFGVLAYYLLYNSYPEGIFPMPSEKNLHKIEWDLLLTQCLQKDPTKRPSQLKPLLSPQRVANVVRTYDREEVKKAVKEKVAAGSKKEQLTPIIRDPQIERPVVDADPASVFRIDTTVKVYHPAEKEIKNVQPIPSDMVIIKGGQSWRGSKDGSRDEQPRHPVTLSSFAIDIHPITNEQFARFLEAMGGEKDSNHQDIIRLKESRIKRLSGKIGIESGYAKHPVVGVTWYGAVSYAKWVGKRLPTEVEWEIASRGDIEGALYPTGDDIEKSQANFFSSDTTAVMSYQPNGYGLYDMAGNVYEWCHDWYGYNYYETSVQEPENPKGPIQGVYRVLRGGCWKSLKEDLRCSRRHRNNPGTVNSTYGFRCATDVR